MIKTNEKLTQEVDQLKSEIEKIYRLIGHAASAPGIQAGKEALRAAADAKKVGPMKKVEPMGSRTPAIPTMAMPPKKALNETSNETTRT